MAAARIYAVNTGAPLVLQQLVMRVLLIAKAMISLVNASVSSDDAPLVYTSLNTTGLASTEPYDADAEQSWGILQQINSGFPSYIPKVLGNLVSRVNVSVSEFANSDSSR